MNKTLFKISNKLHNHDSIIMACSTFGCKNILTLEKGYIMYWVRIYENGKIYEQTYGECFTDAKEMFYRYRKNNSKFKYNNYDGGLKHYEHE